MQKAFSFPLFFSYTFLLPQQPPFFFSKPLHLDEMFHWILSSFFFPFLVLKNLGLLNLTPLRPFFFFSFLDEASSSPFCWMEHKFRPPPLPILRMTDFFLLLIFTVSAKLSWSPPPSPAQGVLRILISNPPPRNIKAVSNHAH